MKKTNNTMEWSKGDPRWSMTWWGDYKTYHRMHDEWHKKFVKINAWSWAREIGVPLRAVVDAMDKAWAEAPYRCDIHGVQIYRTEMKKYISAFRRAIRQMGYKLSASK